MRNNDEFSPRDKPFLNPKLANMAVSKMNPPFPAPHPLGQVDTLPTSKNVGQ